MEQPILEDKVRYYRKKVGKGTAAQARLFPDRVEIVLRDGSPVDSFPIAEITETKEAPGAVLWLNTGEQRHGLCFVLFPFVLMGLLGILLSGAGGLRQAWVQELSQIRRSSVPGT